MQSVPYLDPYKMSREACDERGIIDVHVHGCQPHSKAYLDGVYVENVFRLCEREGWMDRYAMNTKGTYYIVYGEEGGEHPAWERLTGKVEIREE